MARYHVKADGSMGICTARDGNCPFGDDEGTKHFASEAEARIYSERLIKDLSTNGSKSLKKSISAVEDPVTQKLPCIKSNNGVVLEYDPAVHGYVATDDNHVTKEQLIGDYRLDPHMVQDYFDSYDNDLDPDEAVDSNGGAINVYDLSKLPGEFMNNDWYAGYDTYELKDSMDSLDKMYDRDYLPLKSNVKDLIGEDDFEDPDDAQGVIDRIDDQMVEVEGLIAELDNVGSPLEGFDSEYERETAFYQRAMASINDLDGMKDECEDMLSQLEDRKDEIEDWIDEYDEDE